MKLTNPETENQSVKKMEDGQIAILTGACLYFLKKGTGIRQ